MFYIFVNWMLDMNMLFHWYERVHWPENITILRQWQYYYAFPRAPKIKVIFEVYDKFVI